GALVALDRVTHVAAAPQRGCGGDGQRDDVHGVEPVGGERKGVYGERPLDRARAVARGALGRSTRRGPARPPARADRVPARAHGNEPPHGSARRARLLVYVLVTDPRALVRPRFLIAAALVA